MTHISVSQNFLRSQELVQKLISEADINSNDIVLDIGAGKGIITQSLLGVCSSVICIEFDETLYNGLLQKFGDAKNVTVIHSDFMKYRIPVTKYKVFSNIPFNLTSAILNKLLMENNSPEEAYIIMQKEAAQRYLGFTEGFLINSLLYPFFEMAVIYEFKKTDFEPVPNVEIVLFKISKRKTSLIEQSQKTEYFDFVSYITVQQKPSLKLRMEKVFTYEQIKRIFSDLKLTKEATIKDLDSAKWLKLYEVFVKYVPENKKYLTNKAYANYLNQSASQNKSHRTKNLFHKD